MQPSLLNLESLELGALGLGETTPVVPANVAVTPRHSTKGTFLEGVGSSGIFGGATAPEKGRWASSC